MGGWASERAYNRVWGGGAGREVVGMLVNLCRPNRHMARCWHVVHVCVKHQEIPGSNPTCDSYGALKSRCSRVLIQHTSFRAV